MTRLALAALTTLAVCAVNTGAARAQTDKTHAKFDFRPGRAAVGCGYKPGFVGVTENGLVRVTPLENVV